MSSSNIITLGRPQVAFMLSYAKADAQNCDSIFAFYAQPLDKGLFSEYISARLFSEESQSCHTRYAYDFSAIFA